MIVRPAVAADRAAALDALERCGAFTPEEVEVAIGMFDEGVAGDYTLVGAEIEGALRGYSCVGRAWLTRSSWYVYWICVHPAWQRRGVGQALQRGVEAQVRRSGGGLLVLETSSRDAYARSRRFYEGAGFVVHGRLPDFYAPGDDCVVYGKTVEPAG